MIDCSDARGPVFAVFPMDEGEVLDLLVAVLVSIIESREARKAVCWLT